MAGSENRFDWFATRSRKQTMAKFYHFCNTRFDCFESKGEKKPNGGKKWVVIPYKLTSLNVDNHGEA